MRARRFLVFFAGFTESFAEGVPSRDDWSKDAAGRQDLWFRWKGTAYKKGSERPPKGLRAGEREREGKRSGSLQKIDSRGVEEGLRGYLLEVPGIRQLIVFIGVVALSQQCAGSQLVLG